MIPVLDSVVLDLGRDRERINDVDAVRQTATVNHLLRSFYGPEADRREVQILADEVGMGKTFVALGVAYTLLSLLRDSSLSKELEDLSDCYRCVLVITPGGNPTLAEKWDREDEALKTRCSCDPVKTDWFTSILCKSSDELLQALLRADDLRRKAPVVLIAQASVFTKRLSDPAVRFLTACLFRWWGNGLQMRERYHVVRGLSETAGSGEWEGTAGWAGPGEYEVALWDWARHERYFRANDGEREQWEPRWERRLFSEVGVQFADMSAALDRFARGDGQDELDELRRACQQAPTRRPGDERTAAHRNYRESFYKLKDQIRDLFKRLWPNLLSKRFPLVITDEAHHWRNNEAGDFRSIRQFIAPFAKRMLLLTATPFQLNPQETINVLNVVEHMGRAVGANRVEVMKELRDRLAERLRASEIAGAAFSREWGMLADQMRRWDASLADMFTPIPGAKDARTATIGEIWSRLSGDQQTSAPDLEKVPGPIRPFFARAMELRAANHALRDAMRPLIVRHRRSTQHRRYWVGEEYPAASLACWRPDRNRIHLAPGQSLEPKDELVQYLLMKVVAALSRGRHRTTLGTALTGCYSTMWESNEGRRAVEAAARGDDVGLLGLLQRLTGKGDKVRDAEHPKLRRVVDAVLALWDCGEKSLIFCYRVPTAKALHATLLKRIDDRLKSKRTALLKARGSLADDEESRDKAMQQFRRSLTAREASGVPLFLDRVLVGWYLQHEWIPPALTEGDLRQLAQLMSRATLNGRVLFPDFERPDRVFLHRAIEHVWARRFLADAGADESVQDFGATEQLLKVLADEEWVCYRYGRLDLSTGGDAEDDVAERAARSTLAARYALKGDADVARTEQLEAELLSRYRSGRESVLTTIVDGPNIFGPRGAPLEGFAHPSRAVANQLTKGLLAVTRREESWDWEARRDAVDAVVRALLRDDVLLRMPVGVFRGHDGTWAEALFRGLHKPIVAGRGGETLAQRVVAFLRELSRMSGKERASYLAYATNAKAEAVALVTGETKADARDAVFCGFNTPLLPEILVCTAVGQEGIDLHRECRHVIHYDLGWNPATIEQRTGRTDRIGSKAERERKIAVTGIIPGAPTESGDGEAHLPGLDVALPYLAATYDERMFDVLRMRAQVFEILTGGDPTADRDSQDIWLESDDEGAAAEAQFVPLPQEMLEDLKVELGVVQPPLSRQPHLSSVH